MVAYSILAVLLGLWVGSLRAGIVFSSKQSQVTLGPTAQLQIGTPITGWSGTLVQQPGSGISGSTITFVSGGLQNNTGQASVFTGVLSPALGGQLSLTGGGMLDLEPGLLANAILVSGVNNRIEGQPVLSAPLTLNDMASSVTLALQSRINRSVQLNGGLLFLEDDLNLGDGVQVIGPGTIQFNGNGLITSEISTIWTSDLTLDAPNSILLNSPQALSGQWQFSGSSILNGNGNILDLSAGGQLVIGSGTTLFLNDIILRGVTNSSFIMFDKTSQIRMANVAIELEGDVTTTSGGIYIDGYTNFILKTSDWTFSNNASLTVDGALLQISHLNDYLTAGFGLLQVPLPLYVAHMFDPANESIDKSTGIYTLMNSATVKEEVFSGSASFSVFNTGTGTGGCCDFTPTLSYLLSGSVTVTFLILDGSGFIPPGQFIKIDADVTLDGNGNTLFFTHPSHPQLIVSPGKSLTLKHIEFGRLNETTLNIAPDASLFFDRDVQLELSQDITVSQGHFGMKDTGVPHMLNIRGGAGLRQLTFVPTDPTQLVLFDLNISTLSLQEIELRGVQYFSHSTAIIDDTLVTGAIALAGGASIDFDQSTDMPLVFDGVDNTIRLLRNNLIFSGPWLFGDSPDNVASIKFALTSGLVDELIFNLADDVAILKSTIGRAGIKFLDFAVHVNNFGSNSFVMDAGSSLEGFDLFISGFPIKQLSNDVDFSAGLVLSSDLPNAIDSSFIRSFRAPSQKFSKLRPTTAYHQLKEKKNKPIYEAMANIEQAKKKPLIRPVNSRPRFDSLKKRSLLDDDDSMALFRDLTLPTPVTTPIPVETSVQLTSAGGIISMGRASLLFDFGIDPIDAMSLIMNGEGTVLQGIGTSSITTTLKSNDAIFVVGRNNRIIVTGDLIFLGQIFFDDGAELVIEFDKRSNNTPPRAIFGGGIMPYTINLPKGARLRFTGEGEALLSNQSVIASTAAANEDKPVLLFDNFAAGSLFGSNGVSGRIRGNLQIQLTTDASFIVHEGQQLYLGNEFGNANADSLSIVVNGDARFGAEAENQNRTNACDAINHSAIISVARTNFDMTVAEGGSITLGSGGLIEIGAINNVPIKTKINFITFGRRSILQIDRGGVFALAPNEFSATNPLGTPINWNNFASTLIGDGVVRSIDGKDSSKTFDGKLQDQKFVADLQSFDLVRRIVNLSTQLIKAVYFQDACGNYWLRTRKGILVQLDVSEDELRENADTGDVSAIKNGELLIISEDGVRK